MLWYKSWLETRYRMLQVLGMVALMLVLNIRRGSLSPDRQRSFFIVLPIVWAIASALLAGAGIKTQAPLQATKGLHGSMYFTLSLPVSRLRLLAVRSGLGLLEMCGIIAAFAFGAWTIISGLRSLAAPLDMVEYLLTIVTCVSSFYFLSVLFATFLDDMWQVWASFIAIALLRLLFMMVQVPPSLNVFGAMGASSPLFTHTLPWATMGVSLLIAALLFFAALKVVQAREY